MRLKKENLKKIKILFLLGAIVSVVLLSTFFIIYTLNVKEISEFYEVSSNHLEITDIHINNHLSMGDVSIEQSIKNPNNVFEANWNINYKGIYIPSEMIIINYEVNMSIFKINIYGNLNEESIDRDIIYSHLCLNINPDYQVYHFNSDSKKGNIKINTHNINISTIEIESSSGNIDVQLNNSNILDDFGISTDSGIINLVLDNLNFSTDFFSISDSGYQYFNFWNLKFSSGAELRAISSTGMIKLRWANHYLKSQNVNIVLYSKNNVEFRFWSPIQIMRFDITLVCYGSGSTRFTGVPTLFTEISPDHYQSKNIGDSGVDMLTIKAISSYGEAYVRHIDCFKMKRFCDYDDINPYEEELQGNYEIPVKDHDIDQIELFNIKYIYLNETKALKLNLDYLQNTSNNIIYFNWDIKYMRGSSYGKTYLKIDISNKTEGNELKVYIRLDFELDRMLPYIVESNFTVLIHPDYSFNNYTI